MTARTPLTTTRRHALLGLALAGALAWLPACGSTPPSRFYVLRARPAEAAASLDGGLLVEPVRLPGTVDRSQMVTRVGEHELRLNEFDRWAEPLDDHMTRVLAENLLARLDTLDVVPGPAVPGRKAEWSLEVRITHFELALDAPAELSARWTLRRHGNPMTRGATTATPSAPCADHAAMASAVSDALAEVSDAIAAAIASA